MPLTIDIYVRVPPVPTRDRKRTVLEKITDKLWAVFLNPTLAVMLFSAFWHVRSVLQRTVTRTL